VAWSRILHREAVGAFDRISDELLPVDVGGARRWALKKDIDTLLAAEDGPIAAVNLLPSFDVYLLGHGVRDHLMPRERLAEVYRPQGWLSPVVLSGGRVAGVWSSKAQGRELVIQVRLWERLDRERLALLRERGQELAHFLGLDQGRIEGPRTR
jgi:hypothetical protein